MSSISYKIFFVLCIGIAAWLLIKLISRLEKRALMHLQDNLTNDFRARRMYTQARLFKRIAIGVVVVLALSLSAMLFDNIREIGVSLLASAGLATLIIGFAAQKTLGNLFSGIQIAITQPISINDAITIENEFGVVEEISLTYVVIRIWDLRRLIVPINYFLEQPFQNLTRTSSNLLCPVMFRADYKLPIKQVREKFLEILKASEFWDGQISILQVTEADHQTIQIRALASAADAGHSWNLKCEILEKLIEYIAENYPDSLPKYRNLQLPDEN